jgi:hypothetical protein
MLPKWKQQQNRKQDLPMVEFCIAVALHQIKNGRWFIIENPQSSAMWNLNDMIKLSQAAGVSWGVFDQCCYGLCDPESKLPYYKPTCFLHNIDPDLCKSLFIRCPKTHEHQTIEGSTLGKNRSAHAQIYPRKLCSKTADVISQQLERGKAFQSIADFCDITFLDDLFEETGEHGNLALSTESKPLSGLDPPRIKDIATVVSDMSLQVAVIDTRLEHLLLLADSLPRGCVVDLSLTKTNKEYDLAKLAQAFRIKYMPNQHFERAIVSRGVVADIGEAAEGLLVMWKRAKHK